jgi:quercetin dioxygenase-like cupin family protein
MSTRLIHRADARRTETPNAVMTTLASPSLSGTETLSLWRTEMPAGNTGPLHVFDSEQVWTALTGELDIALDGHPNRVSAGDTLSIPAGVERQVTAIVDTTCLVCGSGDAVVSVPGTNRPQTTPDWIA